MGRFIAFFAAFACGWSAQVTAPNVGSARFAGGRVFLIQGIPANFLVAKAPWTAATAVSFSDAGGLLAQNGTLNLVGRDGTVVAAYGSGEPRPVLNIDGLLSSAIAWLPSKHTLLYWTGPGFVPREVDVNDASFAGTVTYIQFVSPHVARLLVTHSDSSVSSVAVSVDTGELISSDILPSAHGRAFAQGSFLVSQDARGLTVESAAGLSRTVVLASIPLPDGDLTLERMSTNWLHIFSASTGRHWALYLDGANLQLSALPVPPADRARTIMGAF